MKILQQLTQENLLRIVAIVGSAWLVLMLIQRVLPWIANKFSGHTRLYLLATVPLLRLGLIVLALVMIITSTIEPTLQNVIALLGATGLALGFAFKDYISSLIAGIVTLYEFPYRHGDWITIDNIYGEVQTIGMRTLNIITPDETTVVIPHAKLWNSLLLNANNGTQQLQCVADFYLHPHHDAAMVRQLLADVGATSPFLQIPLPVKVIAQETPWGTHYRLKAYPVDPRDQFDFLTDLTVRGKAALIASGAQLLFSPVSPMNQAIGVHLPAPHA